MLTDVPGVPRAVARYFAYAFAMNQRRIREAHLRQDGLMRGDARSAWRSFTATEAFSTEPIAFTWDAAMGVAPLLSVRVRDRYRQGRGSSEARILGVIPLAAQRGTPESASASLLRYLAETPWLPTALLPSGGLAWTELSTDRARATLTDAGVTVSCDFSFDRGGAIAGVTAMRHRDVGGRPVLTRWSGAYSAYERLDGMLIPTRAEVSWSPPDGEFAVWRGRIADARYVYAGVV